MKRLVFLLLAVDLLTGCSPSGKASPSGTTLAANQGYLFVAPDMTQQAFYQWTVSANGSLSGSIEGADLSIEITTPDVAIADEQPIDMSFRGFISGSRISLTSHAGGTIGGTLAHDTMILTIPDSSGTEQTAKLRLATIADYNNALRSAKDALSACVDEENNPTQRNQLPASCYAFVIAKE